MRRDCSSWLMDEMEQVGMNEDSKTTYWPELRYERWASTASALHLWTQVVGKVRLVMMPWVNHSWHVPLYVTARGLTTSPMPCGGGVFEMSFDFLVHELVIQRSDGRRRAVPLVSQSTAAFYQAVMTELGELDIPAEVYTTPSEIEDATPFEQDHEHREYDHTAAERFWRALVQIDRVFKVFRARFIGKCSPVHFFWGSFDLAVTRFSGREAPPHPGGCRTFRTGWRGRRIRTS